LLINCNQICITQYAQTAFIAPQAKALAAAAAAEQGEEGEADVMPDAAAAADGDSKAAAVDGEEGELPEEGEAMQGVEGPGALYDIFRFKAAPAQLHV
jgi:hypothetical protein